MKKFTTFITKFKTAVYGEYLKYTLIFLGLMLGIYFYMIFAGMAPTPKFTYAEY